MKKYLITGGAGFIGSHLADTLVKRGDRVIVIDFNDKYLNPETKFFKLDICDPKILNVFKKEKPDIVYHLAGPINLRREIGGPLFNKSLNLLDGFKKILDYSHNFKIKKVVFLSSGGAIYSKAKIIPASEKDSSQPSSLYGLANLILEKLLDEYYKAFKLNFIILRSSNVYGPRQWESGVVPSFIKNISENKSPLIRSDGTQTRDFIYIDDAVSALLVGGEAEKSGIFNVGSEKETTLNELFGKIARIFNRKISPKYYVAEKDEIQRSVLDCSKIKKELKWKPKISLNEGLKKTINWYEKYSF